MVRAGIENLKNTCYLNSVVQALIHFRSRNLFDSSKPFGREFLKMSNQIETEKKTIFPFDFKNLVDEKLIHFRGEDQHDAH